MRQALYVKNTVLVSIMHVNNETGALRLLKKSARKLQKSQKQKYAVLSVTVWHKRFLKYLNLSAFGADYYSVSAHKIHGLKGTGFCSQKRRSSFLLAADNTACVQARKILQAYRRLTWLCFRARWTNAYAQSLHTALIDGLQTSYGCRHQHAGKKSTAHRERVF